MVAVTPTDPSDVSSRRRLPAKWLDRIPPLLAVIGLIALWPSLAVAAKRWHDRDKSGWWVLISFIPILGFVWTFIECGCMKGTEGDNRFGPDPLGPELVSVFD